MLRKRNKEFYPSRPTLLSRDGWLVPEPWTILDKLHTDPICIPRFHRGYFIILACRGWNFTDSGRECDMVLMLGGTGGRWRHIANSWPQSDPPFAGWSWLGWQVALLWQRWLGMRKGDGDGGVAGAGGWVKLRSKSGVAVLLVSVWSSTLLHGRVVVMWVLLDGVRIVGVRPGQHQPPSEGSKARNWFVKDRGALHAAGCRLGRWWWS